MSAETQEFDKVLKPKTEEEKKTIQNKQEGTFKDIDKPDKPAGEEPKESEWNKYFSDLNEKYAKTVRDVGVTSIYKIPIIDNEDGTVKEVSFSRKKPTVAELRLIAQKQKEYDEKPKKNLSLFEAQELASLYSEFAEMLLINNNTGKPITRTEFEQQDWGFIRSVIDNCLLKSLVGSTG